MSKPSTSVFSETTVPAYQPWIECINSQDLAGLTALMTNNHTLNVGVEAPVIGKQANERAWQGYFEAYPNYHIYVLQTYPYRQGFLLYGHTHGSHVPEAQEDIPFSVIWQIDIEDTLIARWRVFDNTASARAAHSLPAPQQDLLHIQKSSEQAEDVFSEVAQALAAQLPLAKIDHVGSTAVTDTLTKGDIDIALGVSADAFDAAEATLARVLPRNLGSDTTPEYASFEFTYRNISIGIQLYVQGSAFSDRFLRFRDLLRRNTDTRKAYNALKRRYHGKPMSDYRQAKGAFIEQHLRTGG